MLVPEDLLGIIVTCQQHKARGIINGVGVVKGSRSIRQIRNSVNLDSAPPAPPCITLLLLCVSKLHPLNIYLDNAINNNNDNKSQMSIIT